MCLPQILFRLILRYNDDMDGTQQKFFDTLDEMEKPQSCFMTADLTRSGFCIKLEYERSAFISDIKKILLNHSSQECQKLQQQCNFTFVQKDTFDTIDGYPRVLAGGNEKLNTVISCFFDNNRVLTDENCNKELCTSLNAIVKALPEFLLLTGKLQHHTHSYSVDVHTLKVLQGVMQDSRYPDLPQNDRRALQIAVLLHDLTKKEGEIDKTHPQCASIDAGIILKRFDLPDMVKKQICILIRHHDWLERYNKGITSAQEFARILKDGNNFLMECIIAGADLRAVQRDGGFYEKFKGILEQGEKQISAIIHHGVSAA